MPTSDPTRTIAIGLLPLGTLLSASLFVATAALGQSPPGQVPAGLSSAHEGEVVTGQVLEVGNNGFTMVDRGGIEHSHSLTGQAVVTLDGRQSGVNGLKAGDRVRVVSLRDDPRYVTRVEAVRDQLAFGSELIRDGRLVSLEDGRLTLNDRTGYPHEYTLAENVACTLDGEPCVPSDLQSDMTLRLTSSRDSALVVDRIEALHQHTSFVGGNQVEGTVKGYIDRKLMFTDVAGHDRTVYVSGPTVVSIDGQPAHPETLAPGTRILVHVRPDAPVSATHVEAIRNHAIFGVQTVHEGRVVDLIADRLTMIGEDGNTHTHTVLDRARCLRDGEPCQVSDIQPDDRIRVTVKWGDHQVVTSIEALDQDTEFATPGSVASGTQVAPVVQSPPTQALPRQDPTPGPVIVP